MPINNYILDLDVDPTEYRRLYELKSLLVDIMIACNMLTWKRSPRHYELACMLNWKKIAEELPGWRIMGHDVCINAHFRH